MAMPTSTRPKPFLEAEYCKGCLRCIDACAKDCITQGEHIHSGTGMIPGAPGPGGLQWLSALHSSLP